MIKVTTTAVSDLLIKCICIGLCYVTLDTIIHQQDNRSSYQRELDGITQLQRNNQAMLNRNRDTIYHLADKDLFRVEELESLIREFIESQKNLVMTEKSIEQNPRAARQLLVNPDRSIFVYEVNIGFVGSFLDLKMILYQLSQVDKLIIMNDVKFDAGDFPVNRARVSFYAFAI
ncbi:MAG: hypothetical protein CMF46_00280 [Legionellales bacterium]|nr:hypothetical protein [Legionellales bacterium]|tara:strand:- start:1321 stop:1842 length:522 start_codon:yes stop_codon:yes gene_type:complete